MEPIFHAVAEPTRRELLERLRHAEALTLRELTEPLKITRQAVAKHLAILEAAGLIDIEWRGREKLHRLDPAPLEAIDRWLQPYAAAWDRRLERLRRHLEEAP